MALNFNFPTDQSLVSTLPGYIRETRAYLYDVIADNPTGGGIVVNIKSSLFGAVGDGVTDDTDAIYAAIEYVLDVGGGTIFFPFGTYIVSASLPLAIPSSTARITFKGDPGAIIYLSTDLANNDTGVFAVSGSPTRGQVVFEDLKFHGNSKTGSGIVCTDLSERTTIHRCSFRDFLGRGAWLNRCIGVNVIGCHALANGYGMEISGTSSIGEGMVIGSKFESNTTRNLLLGTGITFMTLLGNVIYGTAAKSLEIADGAYCIKIVGCSFEQANESIYCPGSINSLTVENCLIPCQSTSGTKYGIYIGGNATNCRIGQNIYTQEADAGCTAVSLRIAGLRTNLVIGPDYFAPTSGAGTFTNYSPSDLPYLHGVTVDDWLGIGTTGANEACAALEVKSSSKGALLPRMSSGLRDNITPVEGLIIYNTTLHCLQYWNASTWVSLTVDT